MDGLSAYQLAIISLGAIGFGVWFLVKGGDLTIDSAIRIAEDASLSKLWLTWKLLCSRHGRHSHAGHRFENFGSRLGG